VLLIFLLLLGGVQTTEPGAAGGLEALARGGHWNQILSVAARRADQLPLRPEEALVAAYAAGLSNDVDAQTHFLELALVSSDFSSVARVELAELVVGHDPNRAFDLVSGLLRRAPTSQLRLAAIKTTEEAVSVGLGSDRRANLERLLPSMNRRSRRGIELALALSTVPVDRIRMSRLLASSTADLVALTAAGDLQSMSELSEVDRWRVANTFYRHGLYDRAALLFESLDDVRNNQISRREVAYLRGRCAFRREEWASAVSWYRKAISRASAGERRAELEVHLGRTYELAGNMDEAVAAAQRAVRLKTSDDRRLFLARIRLRRDEPELAGAGLARLRSRSARARGQLMLGLDELRTGHDEVSRSRLEQVNREPWQAPAVVIAAELALVSDQPSEALDSLVGAAIGLDSYWAAEARSIMSRVPAEFLGDWRRREVAALGDPAEKVRELAMARLLILEPDPDRVAALRKAAVVVTGLEGEPEKPEFTSGIAADLWAIGLRSSALRWDPKGLPRDDARSTWWTAEQELELGQPWLAVSVADTARWQASPYIPERGLPTGLRLALYPLPFSTTVARAASMHDLPWSLLAGVAREESRWNPDVVSKVGARGLMQLMPATAVATGVANGRPQIEPDDLFEPFISLDLGAAELGRLLAVFDGNRAAAVAAYNAGEAQARLWLNQCGEECSEARFLAHVSFSVTRGYTEAVLGAAAVYQELYGESTMSSVNE
jgi:tetratricopeptide (TPR) repeat protein